MTGPAARADACEHADFISANAAAIICRRCKLVRVWNFQLQAWGPWESRDDIVRDVERSPGGSQALNIRPTGCMDP